MDDTIDDTKLMSMYGMSFIFYEMICLNEVMYVVRCQVFSNFNSRGLK